MTITGAERMEARGAAHVAAFLSERGLSDRIRTFGESTHSSEAAARALAVEPGQVAKTMLLLADGSPVVAVLPGDRRVDFRRAKEALGAKRVRMGGAEDVTRHTGFAVGAVSPVALPDGLPVHLDDALRRFASIFPAAGDLNSMFATTPEELASLCGGAWCSLSGPPAQEGEAAPETPSGE
jgi:Cys-tRNA(Pro) deacylase